MKGQKIWPRLASLPRWARWMGLIVLVILFLLLGLTIWRNSTPEISDLKIAGMADMEHRPVQVLKTVPADAPWIWVTGRLAHVPSTEVTIELLQDGKKMLSGYPVRKTVIVKPYPNNYFSYMIKEPQEEWQQGYQYVIRVYSNSDKYNPWKPSVRFKVVKGKSPSY